MEVEILLGCKSGTLSFGVFDKAHGTKGEESFRWIRVEFRLDAMEGDIGDSIRMLSGRARKIDAISTVLLEVKDQLSG
jgi:hypothetical protein